MANDDLILHVAVAAIVLSTVAIILRFWSRWLALKGRYSVDDWLALIAWVSLSILAASRYSYRRVLRT